MVAEGIFQLTNGNTITTCSIDVHYEEEELKNLQGSYIPLLWTELINEVSKINQIYTLKNILLVWHAKNPAMKEYIIRVSFLDKGFDETKVPKVPNSFLTVEWTGKNEHHAEETFLTSKVGSKYIDRTKYEVKAFLKGI